MTLIYNCYTEKTLHVNSYEDNNQCNPVEGTSLVYDYIKSPAILDMCGIIFQKDYRGLTKKKPPLRIAYLV